MNQTKIPWTLLITLLAAVVFGFFCFLSLNFMTMGDTLRSVIVATIITLILGGLCAGAIILKRTDSNFKTHIIIEWILLFLFILSSAIFICWPFSHYFTVSANKKDIQNTVLANISQAENMYADYRVYADHRLEMYEAKLNSVCAAKKVNPQEYSNFGFDNTSDDKRQVRDKLDDLTFQLYPSNFDETDSAHTMWIRRSKNEVDRWKPIGVVAVVRDAENFLTKWSEDLAEYSTYRADGEEAEDFTYPLSFNDISEQMQKYTSPTSTSILYGVGLCLLMLLSYLITGRHPRFPGLKVIFGNSKSLNDKEL